VHIATGGTVGFEALVRWGHPERGLLPMRMFVNLSARQFRHPELIEEVAAVLRETGLDPSDLALEITERVMM
jgi:EAL domain-containing protein (putative c-di-GMP-specific phosphodiesterase class I)